MCILLVSLGWDLDILAEPSRPAHCYIDLVIMIIFLVILVPKLVIASKIIHF